MKVRIRSLALAALAAMMSLQLHSAHAQQNPKERVPVPMEDTEGSRDSPKSSATPTSRIYPGDAAPDFVLDGSNGKSVKLSSLRGDWVALVFYDRADSIPALQPINHDLRRLGVRLVAVVREKATRVRTMTAREQLSFLTLADVMGQIAALYGLRDASRSETRPAFLLLDRRGTVRLSVMGQAMPAEQILQLTRGALGT